MIKILWPEYITLNDWAAALIADYAEEPLPMLTDDDKWQEWGNVVINTGVFSRAQIPPPLSISEGGKQQDFKKWQDWAKVFYSIMINEDRFK